MSGRYERVNAHDDDNDDNDQVDSLPQPKPHHAIPNSPPPSFRSRASSPTQRGHVDPDLADAFDTDDASDDDEPDDRQRLVRQSTTPSSASISSGSTPHFEAVDGQATSSPNTTSSGSRPRVMGGGIGTDGVFANLSARPERTESEKDEQPPTYEQAAADAAPPYWETTIMAPGFGGSDEVYVDGLPVGSIFSFIWNGMISTSFQIVGFLLTYLLHSTHAAKNGSRAGLGITVIQYGFYMKNMERDPPAMNGPDGYAAPPDPNSHDFDAGDVTDGGGGGTDNTVREWVPYVFMVVGWFILIRSVAEYLKARRHEQLVMQSPDRGLSVPIIAEGETAERVV
ncbi:Metal homeostatis protein BSD2 [Tolypocladium ophioglossoides CBS 100239]|uniref:Metal homeostatis protein BSD2 n=1 Tax=Tolypocladium ophioglossoides (strain CBS 100239) TaxID=1163406 RepID=A0A0L0MVL7_TOLOC|nr:Metal homeostatis protein BSD2 [Tolypocladium ophioglossoides CBS 100239]